MHLECKQASFSRFQFWISIITKSGSILVCISFCKVKCFLIVCYYCISSMAGPKGVVSVGMPALQTN